MNAIVGEHIKCPRTAGGLRRLELGGIAVDVSEHYGGIFFDNYELENFDERHELVGKVLVEHLASTAAATTIDITERIKCPKCIEPFMMRRFYSPQRLLEIDECPACGGIWLDAGELEHLRKIFISRQESDSLFNQVLKDEKFPNKILVRDAEFERATAEKMSLFSTLMNRLFDF